jgi:GNAT superfamily N-acetyltransferase
MWWKETAREFEANKGEKNRLALKARVEAGEEPGLLAYFEGKPIGWCAVAPRAVYPRLARSRLLRPIDDRPVWSITCFYVARAHRRRGVTAVLLRAAVDFVRSRGGRILEGYPITPVKDRTPDAFAYTGLLSAFEAVGFRVATRPSPTRAIVRYEIESGGRRSSATASRTTISPSSTSPVRRKPRLA